MNTMHSGLGRHDFIFGNWGSMHAFWSNRTYRYLVVAAACIALIFVAWSRSSSRGAIRRVLAADKAISRQGDSEAGVLDMYWNGGPLAGSIAQRMNDVDLSDCPSDFQSAYKRHVMAWRTVARVKSNNEGVAGFVKGFYTGGIALHPEATGLSQAMDELEASWAEVQQVAIANGVTP